MTSRSNWDGELTDRADQQLAGLDRELRYRVAEKLDEVVNDEDKVATTTVTVWFFGDSAINPFCVSVALLVDTAIGVEAAIYEMTTV